MRRHHNFTMGAACRRWNGTERDGTDGSDGRTGRARTRRLRRKCPARRPGSAVRGTCGTAPPAERATSCVPQRHRSESRRADMADCMVRDQGQRAGRAGWPREGSGEGVRCIPSRRDRQMSREETKDERHSRQAEMELGEKIGSAETEVDGWRRRGQQTKSIMWMSKLRE